MGFQRKNKTGQQHGDVDATITEYLNLRPDRERRFISLLVLRTEKFKFNR